MGMLTLYCGKAVSQFTIPLSSSIVVKEASGNDQMGEGIMGKSAWAYKANSYHPPSPGMATGLILS